LSRVGGRVVGPPARMLGSMIAQIALASPLAAGRISISYFGTSGQKTGGPIQSWGPRHYSNLEYTWMFALVWSRRSRPAESELDQFRFERVGNFAGKKRISRALISSTRGQIDQAAVSCFSDAAGVAASRG